MLVKVEGVSKKFCRSLKKSLWYGVCDIAGELLPGRKRQRVAGSELRVAGEAEEAVAGSGLLVAGENTSAVGGDRAAGDSGPATSYPPLVTPTADHAARDEDLRDGEFWAVKDVSFELRRGECLGLIGHNGAGKTTLLKMLNGLIKPDRGTITMRGRVGALIALGAGFNPILTGRENIYINGSVLGLAKKEIDEKIDEIIDFAEIREFIDMPVQSYSSGMTVRLGFAVASNLNPDILILDEVLAVGDMAFQAKCLNALGKLRATGTTFILVSHNALNISRHCNRVAYMKKGRLVYFGDTSKGVEMYEEDMANNSGGKSELVSSIENDHLIAGSGRLKIKSISFQDENDNEIDVVENGSSLKLKILYINNCIGIQNARLEITMRDNNGVLYQYSKTVSVLAALSSTNENTLVWSFESLPINTTKLIFSVVLWDDVYSEIYDWRRGLTIRSKQVHHSTGRIHIASSISYGNY